LPRYAAFLRGINVGGTRVSKDDLCAPLSALGFENVTTFRASGNVIFDAPSEPATKLAKRIEKALADDLGFTKATTFIRTAAEMRALAKDDPFPREPDQKLHVLFCLKKPPASVLEYALETDQLKIGKKELYWAPEGRMLDSQLDLKAVEKAIGPNTMRTKGTVDQIAERWFGT
jgi:uncharacterized protein (DUF1697 family)